MRLKLSTSCISAFTEGLISTETNGNRFLIYQSNYFYNILQSATRLTFEKNKNKNKNLAMVMTFFKIRLVSHFLSYNFKFILNHVWWSCLSPCPNQWYVTIKCYTLAMSKIGYFSKLLSSYAYVQFLCYAAWCHTLLLICQNLI